MKNILNNTNKIAAALLLMTLFSSCSREDPLTDTQLDDTPAYQNELDKWIAKNYVEPYNISVQYKWNSLSLSQFADLLPPDHTQVKTALDCLKKTIFESFDSVGVAGFVKKQPIKEITLIGSQLDEKRLLKGVSGLRSILVFGTDYVDLKNEKQIRYNFLLSILHDFIYILIQNKSFDETSWSKITPNGYISNYLAYVNITEVNLSNGFLTAFARANIYEDFVETASIILSSPAKDYNDLVLALGNRPAKDQLRAKEALVVKYFRETHKIDFYSLQATIGKNIEDIMANNK